MGGGIDVSPDTGAFRTGTGHRSAGVKRRGITIAMPLQHVPG